MIYAINFKESGEVLTPESFKKYWPKYGSNMLQGWRAPKKIYYKLGQAKTGFSHIPDQLKPHLEISEFAKVKSVIDGGDLMVTQKENKAIKDEKRRALIAKWQLERAKSDYEKAKIVLESIDKTIT
jgi:hypothetical protein